MDLLKKRWVVDFMKIYRGDKNLFSCKNLFLMNGTVYAEKKGKRPQDMTPL